MYVFIAPGSCNDISVHVLRQIKNLFIIKVVTGTDVTDSALSQGLVPDFVDWIDQV